MEALLKLIKEDIEVTKETIEQYLDYYDNENVEDLIDDVMDWDGSDVVVSFEVGYIRALESITGVIQTHLNIKTLQKEKFINKLKKMNEEE
jgi:hypothetical protein